MSVPRSLALPAGARRTEVPTARGPLAAVELDPTDVLRDDRSTAASPVLLLPGFTGSKEDFLELLGPLARRGHRVVAIDQRGQHESVGPEDDATAYTLELFAADAADALRAVAGDGGRVHLVGHSFGGLVAQRAAVLAPDALASLTLLCSGPAALPPDRTVDVDEFCTGVPALGKAAAWTIVRARATAAVGGPAEPEIEQFLRRRFEASSTASLVSIARHLTDAPDRVDDVAALGVPVHVVRGEDDDVWPLEQQERTAVRLGAPFTVVPGTGHNPNVEDPTALADVLADFFARVASPAG